MAHNENICSDKTDKLHQTVYMQNHRKSEDFRWFVSEIVGNTAAISAWRTGERDVQPSDRTSGC